MLVESIKKKIIIIKRFDRFPVPIVEGITVPETCFHTNPCVCVCVCVWCWTLRTPTRRMYMVTFSHFHIFIKWLKKRCFFVFVFKFYPFGFFWAPATFWPLWNHKRAIYCTYFTRNTFCFRFRYFYSRITYYKRTYEIHNTFILMQL